MARLGTTIDEFLNDNIEKELHDLIYSWTSYGDGENFLDMDDDFSLYIEICERSRNVVPKEQLKKDIFNSFIIDKSNIPKGKHIYSL